LRELQQQISKRKSFGLALGVIREIIVLKASKLKKGFVTISSKEIHKFCLEKLEKDENECIFVTTHVAKLLNKYAERVFKARPAKWRITTALLEKLFGLSDSYENLKDVPLHRFSNIQFLYVTASLLYEAKPAESDSDGNRN
jgi:hypothetical protein